MAGPPTWRGLSSLRSWLGRPPLGRRFNDGPAVWRLPPRRQQCLRRCLPHVSCFAKKSTRSPAKGRLRAEVAEGHRTPKEGDSGGFAALRTPNVLFSNAPTNLVDSIGSACLRASVQAFYPRILSVVLAAAPQCLQCTVGRTCRHRRAYGNLRQTALRRRFAKFAGRSGLGRTDCR